MKLTRLALAVFTLFSFSIHLSVARDWVLADGTKFSGDLVKYANGTVIIQKDKGGKALYTIDKFSEADQAYVRELYPAGDKKPSPVRQAPKKKVQPPPVVKKQPEQTGTRIPAQVVNSQAEQKAVGDTPFRSYTLEKGDKALPLSGRIQGSAEKIKLEDLRGKLVLIQVWSHNNKYARNHIPYLAKVYEKYKRKGFEIIGLHIPSRDSSGRWNAINQAERALGITWPMNNDAKLILAKRWGYKHVPSYTLVDANGLILYPGVEISDLEGVIRTYMRLDK